MNQFELLAPAGDMERLRTALHFGADAVYAGGPQLQLRANAVGFTMDQLAEGARLLHDHGKKLYVTVNSFARNDEANTAGAYARELHAIGVDGVIVADLGVIAAIRDAAPDLPVHVSTQANCTNSSAARMYHRLGCTRVVLAREMNLREIRQLRDQTPADLELERTPAPISIKVTGPYSDVIDLTEEMLQVTVDLSQAAEGSSKYPVRISVPGRPHLTFELSTPEIQLTLLKIDPASNE